MHHFRNTRVHICLERLGFLGLDSVCFYHIATFPTSQTASYQSAVFLPFSSCLSHLSVFFLSFLPSPSSSPSPKRTKERHLRPRRKKAICRSGIESSTDLSLTRCFILTYCLESSGKINFYSSTHGVCPLLLCFTQLTDTDVCVEVVVRNIS